MLNLSYMIKYSNGWLMLYFFCISVKIFLMDDSVVLKFLYKGEETEVFVDDVVLVNLLVQP